MIFCGKTLKNEQLLREIYMLYGRLEPSMRAILG
jgi:hypothetical protein